MAALEEAGGAMAAFGGLGTILGVVGFALYTLEKQKTASSDAALKEAQVRAARVRLAGPARFWVCVLLAAKAQVADASRLPRCGARLCAMHAVCWSSGSSLLAALRQSSQAGEAAAHA